MTKSVPTHVERWLADDPSLAARALRWIKAYYYQKLPAEFRPISVLHWTSKTAMAASAPSLAYFVYGAISAVQAFLATVAIVIGHSIVSMFDRAGREKHRPDADAPAETVVRVGELLSNVRPRSLASSGRDDAVRSALGIIEVFVRQVTKCEKGDISVSIALYVGESTTKMQIRHRNPGNTRPIGRKFDGDGVLGHYACTAGASPRLVHDIRGFDEKLRRSPTQSAVTYRSFLILPLVAQRNGTERVIGFLSIDSTKPYSFFGSRARIIVVNCQPIVEHIQELV